MIVDTIFEETTNEIRERIGLLMRVFVTEEAEEEDEEILELPLAG